MSPTALEHLYALSPSGIELGLDRVRLAAHRLCDPQTRFRSIQIAGTNGKGTVSCLVAHAALRAGLKVGLFTSPHLHRFAERIRINGAECDAAMLDAHLKRVFDVMSADAPVPLTFFEAATLAAFSIFEAEEVDLAVLEVGLGGRLDATSVAEPLLTAVTSIGLDHQAYLGDTLAAIAAEKAAIARPGVPMVTGRLEGEALAAVTEIAASKGAVLAVLGRDFALPADLVPPWPGQHQRDNTAVAAALFHRLEAIDARCSSEVFRAAIRTAVWPGRFERLDTRPPFIVDCAHNLPAAKSLVQTLTETGIRPSVLLFGALRDKPAVQMLSLLRPFVETVVLVPPPIGRARDPETIAAPGDIVCETVAAGIEAAKERARPGGCVLVTGSVFTVGAVRGMLLGEPADPPIGL